MRTVNAALALALFVVPATARQPPAQPPTFRAATDLVEVDVVVQDRSGRFVADLKPEDFVVREEGAAQIIDLFYVVQGNAIGPGAADPSRDVLPPPAAARGPRIY